MKIDLDYVVQMRKGLSQFHTEAAQFILSNGSKPLPGSQALTEQAAYPRSESILSAYSVGTMLIGYGGEHLTAFVKTITEPVELIASYTCVRSMLESCSLAAWLLDPSINAHDRAGRVFALRYEGLEQQLKFARAKGLPATEITAQEIRINTVEGDATALGFPPVTNAKGKRIGIAQQMPGATDMIKMMLDEEIMYRLLSGVAHGHFWAISGLTMKPGESATIGGVKAVQLNQTDDLQGIAMAGFSVAKALAKPLFNQCQFFGWDVEELKRILERLFNSLQANEKSRFWR